MSYGRSTPLKNGSYSSELWSIYRTRDSLIDLFWHAKRYTINLGSLVQIQVILLLLVARLLTVQCSAFLRTTEHAAG